MKRLTSEEIELIFKELGLETEEKRSRFNSPFSYEANIQEEQRQVFIRLTKNACHDGEEKNAQLA